MAVTHLDPNFFSKLITTQREYDALFANPAKPLLGKTMNPYDPGRPGSGDGVDGTGSVPRITLPTACITYGGHCFPDHNGPDLSDRLCRCPALLQQHVFLSSGCWCRVASPQKGC